MDKVELFTNAGRFIFW